MKIRNDSDMDFYMFQVHIAAGARGIDISHLPKDKQARLVRQFDIDEGEPVAEEPTAAVAADELADMTVAELREYARIVSVELPSGYIPKADLIALIREG